MKKRRKLYEVPLEKDIRYRGPLSYRHLKILGWLCIALSQILVFASLATRFAPDTPLFSDNFVEVLKVVASMSLPLLLVANFAGILDTSDGYKMPMLINGIAAGGITIIFLFVYLRYIVGTAAVFLEGRSEAMALINKAISEDTSSGLPAFNIFIDLFLCTLFMFFIDYRPRRVFVGKKLWIFRAFAILPVLYEACSLVLKYLAAEGIMVMSAVLLPFLTTKPPIMFLVFLILTFFIKNRERLFCKNGRTHQEYRQFLKTKRNSLHFSIFTAVIFLIAGIVDIALFGILVSDINRINTSFNLIKSLNIGDSVTLIIMAPLIMLFSYTRKHKNAIIDVLIPVCGVVLIIFIYLEGAYQAITKLLPI